MMAPPMLCPKTIGLCKRKLLGIISLKWLGDSTNEVGNVEWLDCHMQGAAGKALEVVTGEPSAIVPGYTVPTM